MTCVGGECRDLQSSSSIKVNSLVNNKFVVGSEGCSESDGKLPTFWPLMVHVRSGAGRPGELIQDTFNIEPCWYSGCIPDSIGGSAGLSATLVIVKDRYLVSNICFVKILVIQVWCSCKHNLFLSQCLSFVSAPTYFVLFIVSLQWIKFFHFTSTFSFKVQESWLFKNFLT